MSRIRVYINPFDSNGVYTGWIDVTSDVVVSSLGTITRALDMTEFDIGVFTNSGCSLGLRNSDGKYADVGQPYTIFKYKRADSRVRIVWNESDYDYFSFGSRSDEILGQDLKVFEGLLNDDGTTEDYLDQVINFTVQGYECILDRAQGPDWVGSPPANLKASTLISSVLYTAFAASPSLMGISGGLSAISVQIPVANDITFDTSVTTAYAGKTCRDIINSLLQASNSVLYIAPDLSIPDLYSFYVSDRARLNYTVTISGGLHIYNPEKFYGPASTNGRENIVTIQNISNGVKRIFNYVTWPDYAEIASDVSSIAKYGTRKKELSKIDGISTAATINTLLASIKNEFSLPKREFTLTVPLSYSTISMLPLHQVSLDIPVVAVSSDNLPIYGSAEYGAAYYPVTVANFSLNPIEYFKVIEIDTDLAGGTIDLRLREV